MTHFCNLIWHLVKRDFYLRHTGSALGVLWSLIVPLAQLGVLSFTFGSIIRVDIEDYPAFVFSALLPWSWFTNSLSSAGTLFFNHRDLVRRPAFPSAVLVLVNTLSHLITFLISLPLLYLILGWYGRFVAWNPIALLSLLAIQAALTVGLSFMVATWNVFYRDIAQLVGICLSLLFFLTPIFYRPIVANEYLALLALNPMVPLINGYRAVLFEGAGPVWSSIAQTGMLSALICGLGYWTYRRLEPDVVDTI
ncbi:MAG: type transporter [Nitrospira sp.]|nr:type transporter [Nitrospira sp.]